MYLDAGEQVGWFGRFFEPLVSKHECDEAAQKCKLENRRSWLQKSDEHVGDQCHGIADHYKQYGAVDSFPLA
jgi:uncharacterized membrane protein (UPF0127 family)